MSESDGMKYGDSRKMWHPAHGRKETARWIGWYKYYSQWEFLSDGLVMLGEPHKEF